MFSLPNLKKNGQVIDFVFVFCAYIVSLNISRDYKLDERSGIKTRVEMEGSAGQSSKGKETLINVPVNLSPTDASET